MCQNIFKALPIFYLFWNSELQRGRDRKRFSFCWFTSQMVTMATARPTQSQEFIWVPWGLCHLSLLYPGRWQGTGSEVEYLGVKASTWDVGSTGGSLTHCATALALSCHNIRLLNLEPVFGTVFKIPSGMPQPITKCLPSLSSPVFLLIYTWGGSVYGSSSWIPAIQMEDPDWMFASWVWSRPSQAVTCIWEWTDRWKIFIYNLSLSFKWVITSTFKISWIMILLPCLPS